MIAPSAARPTLDPDEVARFGRIASEWWDPKGKFAPLHKLAPARMQFIRDTIAGHYARTVGELRPLAGLRCLDIGCGGGLVAEPLARLGARVTAIDPSPECIGAARAHAEPQGLAIDYRQAEAEALVAAGETFDAVLCLEVVEHVPEPQAFLAMVARLVRPGGVLIVSTINRTAKAWALAIVGAEYVLRWLPVGTHQWDRFVTTGEMRRYLATAGLGEPVFKGVIYNPFTDRWSLADDLDVNYFAAAVRPAS